MSNGDDEEAPEESGESQEPEESEESQEPEESEESQEPEESTETDAPAEGTVESLEERLDAVESDLEEAETEADLDEVDATLDDIAADLEAADLPEPEDEDEEDAREQLDARTEEMRGAVEDARGPYAEDVATDLEAAAAEIRDANLTERGEADVAAAIEAFLDTAGEHLDANVAAGSEATDDLAAALDDVAGAVRNAGLDPDDDADTIAALLDATDEAREAIVESLEERLDAVEADLEEAETEDDLDEVDATLDDIATDLDAADVAQPEAEDEESPREQLDARLEEVRSAVEDARGPYAEDVAAEIEEAATRVRDTRWTEAGKPDVVAAVQAFLDAADERLDADVAAESEAVDDLPDALDEAAGAVRDAGLDPDDDADTIAALLEATDELSTGLEEAEEWGDLTVREQLQIEGFYDRLTSKNRKDFPPELNVIRIAERENDPERVLMGLEYFESDFMEENCVAALRRMGPPEAYDAMMERAQKRNQPAVEVLGKIGDERALDTLLAFIEGESNPALQKVTLRTLGEIGSQEATQKVADRLVAEDVEVRSHAARALGRIGDTRAVEPLADVLDDADEPDEVRASAAWALVQIGTERALDAAAEYADDRAYIVQHEAEKAREALGAEEATAR